MKYNAKCTTRAEPQENGSYDYFLDFTFQILNYFKSIKSKTPQVSIKKDMTKADKKIENRILGIL